jgi:hypothetical protein
MLNAIASLLFTPAPLAIAAALLCFYRFRGTPLATFGAVGLVLVVAAPVRRIADQDLRPVLGGDTRWFEAATMLGALCLAAGLIRYRRRIAARNGGMG